MPQPKNHLDMRIAIVGAGPAGLSTAHYLKKQGYRNVTVFEKLGRVGGLCHSITEGYKSFDLGGNYITPANRETIKLARSVKARYLPARRYIGARVKGERFTYHGLFDFVRQDRDDSGKHISLWALARAVVRFGWLRHKLRPIIDQPTMESIHNYPELCVSFEQWLGENDLLALRGLFEVPVTTFGYGFLEDAPAPYILKYMHPRTYWAMVMRGAPGLSFFARWPKRFKYGFQRMWERVSWDLDVKLDVKITRITRDQQPEVAHPVCIEFEHGEQILNRQLTQPGKLFFDRLILACPLAAENLKALGLDLSAEESDLFGKVKTYSYCQTTLHCVDESGEPFKLKQPVVIVFPFNRETIGKPWAVVQYWKDESPMIQLYSRVSRDRDDESVRDDVIEAGLKLLERMGARIAGAQDPREARWISYMRWPYFGQVSVEEMSKRFFLNLEKLQGENQTFYVGGVTNFELIEPILEYAKHLVEKHFAR